MSYPPPPEYGYAQQMPPQDHPRATLALILGIVSLVLCSLVGPFAWNIGKRAVGEIDASGGRYTGRGQAQAGYILGVIATVLLVLSIIVGIIAVVGGGLAAMS